MGGGKTKNRPKDIGRAVDFGRSTLLLSFKGGFTKACQKSCKFITIITQKVNTRRAASGVY
jgi:hypothetical protein